MKKLITYSLVILALGYGKMTQAQETSKPGPSLGIGVEVGIPTGDLGEGWQLGLGGSVKGAFPIMENGDITASVGYISFGGKKISGTDIKFPAMNAIPIKAGFRYRFNGGIYVEPQLGYGIYKVKGASESDGAFTYAANVGYLIKNMIDISARYESASKDGSSLSHVGIRIGYAFSLGGK